MGEPDPITATRYRLARDLPLLVRLVADERFPFPSPSDRTDDTGWENDEDNQRWRHGATGVVWALYSNAQGRQEVLPDLTDAGTQTALQGLVREFFDLTQDPDGWWVLRVCRAVDLDWGPAFAEPVPLAIEGYSGTALVAGILRQWRHCV